MSGASSTYQPAMHRMCLYVLTLLASSLYDKYADILVRAQ